MISKIGMISAIISSTQHPASSTLLLQRPLNLPIFLVADLPLFLMGPVAAWRPTYASLISPLHTGQVNCLRGDKVADLWRQLLFWWWLWVIVVIGKVKMSKLECHLKPLSSHVWRQARWQAWSSGAMQPGSSSWRVGLRSWSWWWWCWQWWSPNGQGG